MPIDGIEKEFQGRAKVLYAEGSPYADGVSLPVPRTVLHVPKGKGREGLVGSYFANSEFRGKAVLKRIDREIDFDLELGEPRSRIAVQRFQRALDGYNGRAQGRRLRVRHQICALLSVLEREAYAVYLDGKQVAA